MEVKEKDRRIFRIALASAGMTESDFARQANASPQAIDQVIRGITRSQRLSRLIDMFVLRELRKLRIQLDVWQENRAAVAHADVNGVRKLAGILRKDN